MFQSLSQHKVLRIEHNTVPKALYKGGSGPSALAVGRALGPAPPRQLNKFRLKCPVCVQSLPKHVFRYEFYEIEGLDYQVYASPTSLYLVSDIFRGNIYRFNRHCHADYISFVRFIETHFINLFNFDKIDPFWRNSFSEF